MSTNKSIDEKRRRAFRIRESIDAGAEKAAADYRKSHSAAIAQAEALEAEVEAHDAERRREEAEARRVKARAHPFFGARVEEWATLNSIYRRPNDPIETKTGRVAVGMIYEGEPLRGKYGRPKIGALYLRVLKKDGTPSSNFESASHFGDEFVGWRKAGAK